MQSNLGPPMCSTCFEYCLQQNPHLSIAAPGYCWMQRSYSNGKEQPGVFQCMVDWDGTHESMCRHIALREGARMYGFNPPDPDALRVKSREIARALKADPLKVYSSKPCGEKWNWPGLACFMNWYMWLNEAAQAQVREDIYEGVTVWPYWAMHFQAVCPSDVRDDPFYHAFDDPPGPINPPSGNDIATDLWMNPPFDPFQGSFDHQGTQSQQFVGPTPQPWPLINLGPGVDQIPVPGIPIQPCEPFPQCIQAFMGAYGLPTPCEPFPQCLWSLAQGAVQMNPNALAMTSDPNGRGTYDPPAEAKPSSKPSSSPSWLLPGLLALLGAGIVGGAVIVLESPPTRDT